LKKEFATVGEDFKKELSEYDKAFPPFFVKEHVTLAPPTHFECDEARLEQTRERLDACLAQRLEKVPSLKRSFEDATHEPFAKRRKLGSQTATVKELISRINSEPSTIDLTESGTSKKDAFSLLETVPTKYLRYAEDVRPPYIGTYTKDPVGCSVQRLCRKPFTRALPGVNYDYDSEAEWEEPEEGDECGSDEEDSELEDEDEDMAGFLDDDEDAPKRRNVMGDMDPVFTEIFWQEPKHRRGAVEVSYGTSTLDLNSFRISALLVEATGPIDPFSTAYWRAPEPERLSDPTSMAPPPRLPLNPLLGTNTRLSTDSGTGLTLKPPTSGGTAAPAPQKTKALAKPFPPELLDDFKREIEGSDLSKIGLVEVLKKR
jgi:chromatin assembly factor 1 subunit A